MAFLNATNMSGGPSWNLPCTRIGGSWLGRPRFESDLSWAVLSQVPVCLWLRLPVAAFVTRPLNSNSHARSASAALSSAWVGPHCSSGLPKIARIPPLRMGFELVW